MLADDDRVVALRGRLSADLRAAMKSRDAETAAAVRTLLSRLDQASAVPLTREHAAMSAGSSEVQRRFLTWNEATALLSDEIAEKRRAIATFADLNMAAEVSRLTRQLHAMERYIDE